MYVCICIYTYIIYKGTLLTSDLSRFEFVIFSLKKNPPKALLVEAT